MLHIIYGSDRDATRTQFHVTHDVVREKCSDEVLITEGSLSDNSLAEAASSVGLFGEKTLFVLDNILEKKENQEVVAARAKDLVLSPNYFLVCEPSLEKEIIEALEKAGANIQEYVAQKTNARPAFNIFSLGDALGRRSKKELWVLCHEALDAGCEPEEISGTLFWSVKNMMLLKDAPAGVLCGLNPFIAKKTREFSKNYSKEEIIDLSRALVAAYHYAHNGGEPMDIALERFVLSI